ncbi:hypothetical protein EG329_013497 [Mollisiaceae sp. DMI_Dod_QoI]|nr:hypothetical protein EG329_013497 [Helotiales sp. DMI_Dod_QoI]
MARTVWQKLAIAAKIGGWISTMPWISLQAAIQHVLQEKDIITQEKQLLEWRKRKQEELTSVTIVGTLIASAVTGSIQWSSLSTTHWVVAAFWYSTLLFSLISVIIAFYLTILLSNFAVNVDGNKILLQVLQKKNDPTKSRWWSLFALQMPIMLLSYALIMYVAGLSLMVIRPLWNDPWGDYHLVAIFYCVALVLAIFGCAAVCHFIYVHNDEVLKFD